MSQSSSLSDRDLKVAIANARWDVEYDAKQIAETQQIERSQSALGRLLGGSAVDAQTRQDEIAEYEKDARHLQSLVKEAQRRGLDVSDVPARSNQNSYGDF